MVQYVTDDSLSLSSYLVETILSSISFTYIGIRICREEREDFCVERSPMPKPKPKPEPEPKPKPEPRPEPKPKLSREELNSTMNFFFRRRFL